MENSEKTTMRNAFDKKNISFHGIGGYDFLKLKKILSEGLKPNKHLPDAKVRDTQLGHQDTRVHLVLSPLIGATKVHEYYSSSILAYYTFIKDSIGIVINCFPAEHDAHNRHYFPDARCFEGIIPPDSFLGITVPKHVYGKKLSELGVEATKHESGAKVILTEGISDNMIFSDALKICNTLKLPVYDSITGERLDKQKEIELQR